MTLNAELLDATMTTIERDPEHHDQSHWARNVTSPDCQTTFCFAGHAAILAGAQPPAHDGTWYVDPETGLSVSFFEPTSEHVADYAQKKLGLTDGQADKLFHGANTIPQLRAIVDDYLLLASAGDLEDEN